ncbi:CLUMA_CG007672, isoform A [Clunio marinus]|uniref:CLUMA_CG007672, isoform A n=1 Tax=Clunio marinus TaxID=568069 RepID=A0A1J1I6V9_9DIPT|nr:CLUMA_CG007672, isoform A [Clunio marinus]
MLVIMSTSTIITKNLFDNVELVSSTDPSVDVNNLVFMDSDSESSETYLQNIGLQETINCDKNRDETSMDATENPIHVTVKKEEEINVYDEDFECTEKINTEDNSLDLSAFILDEELIEDVTIGYDDGEKEVCEIDGTTIITIENSFTLNTPLNTLEDSLYHPAQFDLITESATEIKKTEDESKSHNTSLVDHPYSQQPESNNDVELFDDLVGNVLQGAKNIDNRSAIGLLSTYTDMFEHYFSKEENPQIVSYLRNMKNSLTNRIQLIEENKSEDVPAVLENIEEKSVEIVGNETLEFSQSSDLDKNEVDESVEIPETSTEDKESEEQNCNQKMCLKIENAVSLAVQQESIETTKEDDKKTLSDIEKCIRKIKDCSLKLSDDTSELLIEMNMANISEEDNSDETEKKLIKLLINSRKEFRNVIKEIIIQRNIKANEMIERSKNALNNYSSDLSELSSSDSEDLDQVLNLNRKIPKTGPQTPAIVSSTKEDSDASDRNLVKEETENLLEPLSENDVKENKKNVDKDIDRLIDLTSLYCPKPASSKKVSKQKKVMKKKKKRTSDNESPFNSTSGDDSPGKSSSSSSSSSSDRDTSDEEKAMLIRQNADIKLKLLDNSDCSASDEDSLNESDENSPFNFSSDDDKDKSPQTQKKKKTTEIKEEIEPATSGNISVEAAIVEETEKLKSDDDELQPKKKRQKRDSFEREIFKKDFLEENKSQTASTSTNSTKKKLLEKEVEDDKPPLDEKIDLSMFESKRLNKEIDLKKIFEKRANASEVAASSSPVIQAPSKSTPPITNEDEWISLSSDSDSEISVVPSSGSSSRIPKRKKMLTEEELQEETKRAQKEENRRVERLKKKNETLSQMLSERLSQDSESQQHELILDYDSERKITISVHPKIVKLLKDHQKEGIKFMYDTVYGSISDEEKTKSGCILAHCMGLGKTLQLIALLHTLIRFPELETKRVLIICPKSTIMNWSEEFKKWLSGIESKGLRIFYLEDSYKFPERVKLLQTWFDREAPGVFIINYEAFRHMIHYSGSKRAKIKVADKDVEAFQKVIRKCLLDPGPNLVVCDEGHLIKNQQGALNKAIIQIKTLRRIILTGTPVQNNLNEYYSMVDWIKPALLGTVREFNNLYANPIKDGQHRDSTTQMIKKMKHRSYILHRKLSKFVQRKEASVLKEFLPEKYEYCIFVPLTKVQEQLYENYLEKNPLNGGHQLLNDYTALRKIWTHPKVLQNARERAIKGELKINEAGKRQKNQNPFDEGDDDEDDLLDKLDGNTGVTSDWWKQFVGDDELESLFTSSKLILLFEILRLCEMRGEKVLIFSAFVAVLNVVEAFMKKIHSQDFNPKAKEIYRLGQQKPCYVYRLIALGTMEEIVYSRSVNKQAMSFRVVDKLQIDRHYRMDELSELYTLTKFDPAKRTPPSLPVDEVLKFLLHNHQMRAFRYHEHDTLLENKPDQDLNEDEIKEAWQAYENELRGPQPRVPLNGNPLVSNVDFFRADLLNYNYHAGLDPGASDFVKQLYPTTTLDYIANLQSYYNNLDYFGASVPSTSAAGASNALTSNQSTLLRAQLGASLPPPVFPSQIPPINTLYNFANSTPSTIHVKSPTIPPRKRTPTVTTPKISTETSNKMQQLMHLQQRFNGNIQVSNDNSLLGKNSSANLSILPDKVTSPTTSTSRKLPPPNMKTNNVKSTSESRVIPSFSSTLTKTSANVGTSSSLRTSPMISSSQQAARTSLPVNTINNKISQNVGLTPTKTIQKPPNYTPTQSPKSQQTPMSVKTLPKPVVIQQKKPPQQGIVKTYPPLQKQRTMIVNAQQKSQMQVLKPQQQQQKPLTQSQQGIKPTTSVVNSKINVAPVAAAKKIFYASPQSLEYLRNMKAQKAVPSTSNNKSNPISITKLPPVSTIKPQQLQKQAQPSLVQTKRVELPYNSQQITLQKLQPSVINKVRPQQSPTTFVSNPKIVQSQKRPYETTVSEAAKRLRGMPQVKVITREERDRIKNQNSSTVVDDIVEIE